jgi:serine/threonine-protein phosphatase 2A catalytic subunit
MDGYSYAHKKKCVTVFSAPNYCYRCGNQAAALEISDSLECTYQKYDPSPKEKESEPTRRVPEYFL